MAEISSGKTVVGIDVGGVRKGFHAVALHAGVCKKFSAPDAELVVHWCLEEQATVVAVDAPCGWSLAGKSRWAESSLRIAGQKVSCFSTPTRALALAHQKGFYDWVFNGEKLYQRLASHYPLFTGEHRRESICIETFPHAVVCALAGTVVPAKPKTASRRAALREQGYDPSALPNIDFIDAALCAVAAAAFCVGNFQSFGQADEGFIVVPK